MGQGCQENSGGNSFNTYSLLDFFPGIFLVGRAQGSRARSQYFRLLQRVREISEAATYTQRMNIEKGPCQGRVQDLR